MIACHTLGSPPTVVPRPNSSVVTLLSLLNSDSSGVMISIARTVPVFGVVCAKLQRRSLPNLLHSDSSMKVSALAKLDSVIIYFSPLHSILVSVRFYFILLHHFFDLFLFFLHDRKYYMRVMLYVLTLFEYQLATILKLALTTSWFKSHVIDTCKMHIR